MIVSYDSGVSGRILLSSSADQRSQDRGALLTPETPAYSTFTHYSTARRSHADAHASTCMPRTEITARPNNEQMSLQPIMSFDSSTLTNY